MSPLLRAMIEHRSTYHLRRDELTEYRMWRASTPHLCVGMGTSFEGGRVSDGSRSSINEAHVFMEGAFCRRTSAAVDDEGDDGDSSLRAFLLNYRFKATDIGPHGDGLPLLCAAFEGDPRVVRGLLEAHADPNRVYYARTVLPYLGLVPGGNLPLHMAVASHAGNQATIRALLSYGADPNATVSDLALTPLIGGVYYDSAEGLRALYFTCFELDLRLDLERGIENLGWSALMLAAFASTPEAVNALVEMGCNRGAVGHNGYSVIRAACDNPLMDVETLELLWDNGDGVDLNESLQPRSAFWRTLTATSEMAVKCGGSIPIFGGLAKAFADFRGSTPLHGASKAGRLDLVEWLVHRGATRSLHMKTTSGATPVTFAKRAGHYAIVGFLNDTLNPSGRVLSDSATEGDFYA
jgi:ankyrin repeat protein